MNIRYRVELSQEERGQLTRMLSGGKHAARRLKRAQVLLAADAGESDDAIAANVSVSGSTVCRTKRRFVLGNLEAALSEDPRPGGATQAVGPGGGAAGCDHLRQATGRTCPLDVASAGGRDGQVDRSRGAVTRDGAPAAGRERPQALAAGHVVHPAGGWHRRCPHGGAPSPTLRNETPIRRRRPALGFDPRAAMTRAVQVRHGRFA